ncbi:MAG: hypothetical protein LBT99_01050, partial [Bifidobacteriaceae bacterium]|nr:hypothetical protein [Bifidobacteriaceae bacterium]
MEIKKNQYEIRKNWNKFSFKRLGAFLCLFLFGVVTFISGNLSQVNAATSSTVLPVAKGGTELNYFPPNQVLMGNGENTLIGKTVSNTVTSGSDDILTSGGAYSKYGNIGNKINFSMILNSSSSCIQWGTIYDNNFTGYTQPNGDILGSVTIESVNVKVNSNDCMQLNFIYLASGYERAQKINTVATMFNETTYNITSKSVENKFKINNRCFAT